MFVFGWDEEKDEMVGVIAGGAAVLSTFYVLMAMNKRTDKLTSMAQRCFRI